MAAGYMPESCGMSGKCNCYFVVEDNGNVYPCDFYCTDEWKLGTIDDDFNDLIKSDKAKNFVSCSLPVNDKCKKCKYLYLCRGGCRIWREPFINVKPSLNCLCGANEKFFEHCIDRIYLLANIIKIKNVILSWLIMSQLFLFINIVYRKNYDKFHIEKFIILFLLNL